MKTKYIAAMLFTILFAKSEINYNLQYLTPSDLVSVLDCQKIEGRNYIFMHGDKSVQLFLNNSTNQVKLIGPDDALSSLMDIVRFLDVAPRQFIIQVEIIEINDEVLDDIGLDWQNILDRIPLSYSFSRYKIDEESTQNENDYTNQSDRTTQSFNINSSSLDLSDMIRIFKEKNIGTVTNSPRIVTTNNKLGTILDGQHSTYVTRYSSYANIFETEEINSGLSIEVIPSMGESGYISMDITAKYTYLSGNISGSPVETGQILKNHVYVKDNEPFLLGAFKKTEDQEVVKRIPVLGKLIPVLFSNKRTVKVEKNILVVLTPQVIDLDGSAVPGFDE